MRRGPDLATPPIRNMWWPRMRPRVEHDEDTRVFINFPGRIGVKIKLQGANELRFDATLEGPVDWDGMLAPSQGLHLPPAGLEAASSGVPTTSPRTVQHFLIDFPEAPPRDHSRIWQDEGPQASPCRFSRLVRERG